MPAAKKTSKLVYLLLVLLVTIGIFECVLLWRHLSKTSTPAKTSSSHSAGQSSAPASFNKNQFSVDKADSLWAVVNKGRSLPSSYVPANLVVPNVPLRYSSASQEMHLRSDAAAALEQLVSGANDGGIHLMLASGYRSYANQVSTYNGYVKSDGSANADTYSARPGHSEHQTGLAADLEPTSKKCELQDCFGDLPEGKWLADNAYKYGFIIRYQKGDQELTGYIYEPWHLRYIGNDLASQIHSSNQTLEQFFGLPTYTSYPAKMFQLQ